MGDGEVGQAQQGVVGGHGEGAGTGPREGVGQHGPACGLGEAQERRRVVAGTAARHQQPALGGGDGLGQALHVGGGGGAGRGQRRHPGPATGSPRGGNLAAGGYQGFGEGQVEMHGSGRWTEGLGPRPGSERAPVAHSPGFVVGHAHLGEETHGTAVELDLVHDLAGARLA
jgi:hypothetical protein